MKLKVLTENHASGHFLAEHGLSYLIEHDGKTILFDTGHTDIFIKNAVSFGIDIHEQVDLIVLSHGHWDHGGGLRYIQNKPLLCHPGVFINRYNKFNSTFSGLQLSKTKIEKQFKLITSEKPYYITDKIIFLGEIPRNNTFESQSTSFIDKDGSEDYIQDDSALVVINNKKLIIISGCAHSGICNICDYATKLTGIQTIQCVIGGFHLKKNDNQTRETINYFKDRKVRKIYPSHCTELPALAAFNSEFKNTQVKTGFTFKF